MNFHFFYHQHRYHLNKNCDIEIRILALKIHLFWVKSNKINLWIKKLMLLVPPIFFEIKFTSFCNHFHHVIIFPTKSIKSTPKSKFGTNNNTRFCQVSKSKFETLWKDDLNNITNEKKNENEPQKKRELVSTIVLIFFLKITKFTKDK